MRKPRQLAGLSLSCLFQQLLTDLGQLTSCMTQMKRRLPKGHPRTHADVDALLDAVLWHFDDLIASGKNLIGNPSDFVAQHNGPTLGS